MAARPLVIAAVIAAAVTITTVAQGTTPISSAPIRTSGGLVAGQALPSGVNAWLGIPFAKAPVGDLRWRAPEANTWQGVYNADRKMPQCIQILRRRFFAGSRRA